MPRALIALMGNFQREGFQPTMVNIVVLLRKGLLGSIPCARIAALSASEREVRGSSSSPSPPVGAVGAAGKGILAVKDKVNKAMLEKQLAACTTEAEKKELSDRIKLLDESAKKHLKSSSLYVWSAIPVVGPTLALS